MLKKLSSLPLKWKVLLSMQLGVTCVLVGRRLNTEAFDKALFEKRVLKITTNQQSKITISNNPSEEKSK